MFPAGKWQSGDFHKHHLYLQTFVCFPFILPSSSFTQQAIRRLLQSWNNVRFVWHHRLQPSRSSGATKLFESKMGLNLQEPVVTAEPQTLWMPSTCFMLSSDPWLSQSPLVTVILGANSLIYTMTTADALVCKQIGHYQQLHRKTEHHFRWRGEPL